jgi:uncharacterized protein (DUF1697 family)
MPRYAVLLRGINVGRAKQVAMADLKALLEGLGYGDVRTHLRSGNAVVTGADADPVEQEQRIEAAVDEELGLDVRCVVLAESDLRAIVEGHPFPEKATNGSRMMAHVLGARPDEKLVAEHDAVALDPDNTRLGDRVIYQWCPDGITGAPPVGGFAEKNWKVTVTARNWNTMTKLLELL